MTGGYNVPQTVLGASARNAKGARAISDAATNGCVNVVYPTSVGANKAETCLDTRAAEPVSAVELPNNHTSITPNDGVILTTADDDHLTSMKGFGETEMVARKGDLPLFPPMASPNSFTWNDLDGETFCHRVNAAYTEAVHWRRNVFSVPSGKAGKAFVTELSRLWQAYGSAGAMECIALRAASLMCILLLQKPHEKSKAKEHSACLERRLVTWSKGSVEELLHEGRTIQAYLRRKKIGQNANQITRTFTNLMLNGRISAAMRVISDAPNGGLLDLDAKANETQTVREVLKEKHPEGKPADQDSLLAEDAGPPAPHPVIFDHLTGNSIRAAALRTFGGAGPSGLDAAGWRRLCCSFHAASKSLCAALAGVARRIATSYVDPEGLAAFTACRLCPLDKCPGVRPIGISEVPRRLIGKALMVVLGKDVQTAAGSFQLSAGQTSGCEAAVHAMRKLFDDPDTEGVLLVDAKNAFNTLNRQAALWNVKVLCPSLGPTVINTYRSDVELFVGGEKLFSREGTTQGDPLAMAIYSVAVTPLIRKVATTGTKQIWFADDAAGSNKLTSLRNWWNALEEHGPKYGYFVNGEKTWLVTKGDNLDNAKKVFSGTDVNITSYGKRYLGATLGTENFASQYVGKQALEWAEQVIRLAKIATSQPQCAYAAFRRSLSSRWTYLARTVPNISELLSPVENAIRQHFIPALTGQQVPGELERELFALPTRLGGLGIGNPTDACDDQYAASQEITAPLLALIIQQESDIGGANEKAQSVKNTLRQARRRRQAQRAEDLHRRISPQLQRCLEVAKEKGASSWLEALPAREENFTLSKGEFRDALCLRYGWAPERLPATCACGAEFDVTHALSCPTGGLPTIRHNEMRDIIATCLSKVCSDVQTEPHLFPQDDARRLQTEAESGENHVNQDVRLDIRARGFWGGRMELAFFDVRVFNPFARSAVTIPLAQLHARQEAEKRRKYENRLLAENCSFTPLVFSTSGGCSPLTARFLKKLASKLSDQKVASYNQALCWLRTRLSFSLMRAASMCLRSYRKKSLLLCNQGDIEPAIALSAGGLL